MKTLEWEVIDEGLDWRTERAFDGVAYLYRTLLIGIVVAGVESTKLLAMAAAPPTGRSPRAKNGFEDRSQCL